MKSRDTGDTFSSPTVSSLGMRQLASADCSYSNPLSGYVKGYRRGNKTSRLRAMLTETPLMFPIVSERLACVQQVGASLTIHHRRTTLHRPDNPATH